MLMVHRISAWVTIGVCLALATTACQAIPSDPVQPPIGLRQDSGVLIAIIPVCESESLLTADIIDYASGSLDSPSWKATGYLGGASGIVILGEGSWDSITGSYSELNSLNIGLHTTRRLLASVVDSPERVEQLNSLPPDSFMVNGRQMTSRSYEEMVDRKFSCPKPRTE